jgi:hypothetical protein
LAFDLRTPRKDGRSAPRGAARESGVVFVVSWWSIFSAFAEFR